MSDAGDTTLKFDAYATLKLYVDLANSERQTIWARNASMLVGNSFIITAIRSNKATTDTSLSIAFSLCGILICVLWAIMVVHGWSHLYKHMNKARTLPVCCKGNPYSEFENKLHRDEIFLCALGVIFVFVVMYGLAVASFLNFV